jgi:hypothetical protein
MKRSITGRNRLVAGASILTAVGAVALGATVSSGAMASVPDEATATMSMVSLDSDGTAFECTFDLDELPFPLTAAEVVAEGVTVHDGEAPEGVTGATGVIEMGEAIELTPEEMTELGIDPEMIEVGDIPVGEVEVGEVEVGELGELEAAGIAVAAPLGEGVFFEIGPDGEIVETEVTEGTPEQCAALRDEWGS